MNTLVHRALLADHKIEHRMRVREALLGELPSLEVEETGGAHGLVRSLEESRFDLTIVRHPLPSGQDLPVVIKARWPERALLLYAPLDSEHTLADALEAAGDAYFLESGSRLLGLRAALRLALSRVRRAARSPEEEQRGSRDWFATIFKACPVGISLSTLADGYIFDANDRFLEMLGYERQEVLGRTAAELGLGADAHDSQDLLVKLSKGARLSKVEVLFRRKGGEIRNGRLSLERLRLDGAQATLCLLDDISDLRLIEAHRDRLIQSERRVRNEAEAALEEVRQGHRQLEALSRRLVDLQEAERRALARELHDEVGQILASLKLHLENGMALAPERAQALLGDLVGRVRNLSMDLRPPMLDELGLAPTLLWHFERYQAQTGVHVDFHLHEPVGRLAPEVETAAFRIVQEALTNVARHARVQAVIVSLETNADRLELRIEDRGVGFRPEEAWAAGSSGLIGMRERARLLGGRFRVESAPGAGTRVTADLPSSPLARGGV